MSVHTGRVKNRREVRFAALDEAVADAERLVLSDEAGTLRRLGNWSLGQALGHLAYWIDMPFDGYPPQINPPWFVKLIVKMMKRKYLNGGMPAGVKIPRVAGGTLHTEEMTSREGLSRYRRACERLKAGPPPRDNPLFGPLTHQEWINLNLSHAKLHLSFFVPE